ncbi:hypothetical protein BDV97DRAFT_121879 [Delphinella strobiligena]|nr:hypothetical protein BDV97DRAFT_121879 [Delphinella strobiligena]
MSSNAAKRRKREHTRTMAQDIDASNATTRFALGTPQRSWMLDNQSQPEVNNNTNTRISLTIPPHQPPPPTLVTSTNSASDAILRVDARPMHFGERDGLAYAPPNQGEAPPSLPSDHSTLPWADPERRHSCITSPVSLPPVNMAVDSHLQNTIHHNPPQLGVQHGQSLPSPAPSEEHVAKSPPQPVAVLGSSRSSMPGYSNPNVPNSNMANPNSTRATRPVSVPTAPNTFMPPPQPPIPSPMQSLAGFPVFNRLDPWSIFHASVCLPKFNAFVSQPNIHHNLDQYRLKLISEAAALSDVFFMILSLILSWYRVGGHDLPPTVPPLDTADISIVEQIIGVDDLRLSPHVRAFLQNFPMSPRDVRSLLGTIHFRRICNDVSASVVRLRQGWELTVRNFDQHKYLPLARDFRIPFGMTSVCLQRAAFRNVLLRTWGSCFGKPAEQAMTHFVKEQREYLVTNTVNNADEHYGIYRAFYLQHLSETSNFRSQAHSLRGGSAINSPVSPRPGDHRATRAAPGTPNPVNRTPLPGTGSLPRITVRGLLVPPTSAQSGQLAHPNPMQMALHQVHLRDPTLIAKENSTSIHYRYVSAFVLSPQRLSADPIEEIHFDVNAEQLSRIPELFCEGKGGAPPTARFDSRTLMFRLNCCSAAKDPATAWALKETVWPTWLYFSLNDEPLELRRKLQHGKCLPVDVTRQLRGKNTLKIFTNIASDWQAPKHSVAVEIVSFSTKEFIKHDCLTKRVLPTEEVRASITSSLTKSAGQDDDDVEITASSVTIPMFEPFSGARIFDIPVRGVDCLHRHAFDLDVFLDTRGYEGEFSNRVSKMDWKCPICGSDARPQSLVVDGFLQEVRQELEAAGSLNTRTIIVESDGSWKTKAETTDQSHNSDSDSDSRSEVAGDQQQIARKKVAVIEIDSD